MNSLIWPKIELVRDFITVFITWKFDEDLIKNEVPILQNQSFDTICTKTLCSLSPQPVMLRDIQVWKKVWTDDRWWTIGIL